MKKHKVISGRNLLMRNPAMVILLWYLLLDKWNAPQYVWGIVGTIYAIVLIATIIDWCNSENIDIFKENEKP